MPSINVARTDTFEQQRVKINQIGTQIFNISAGGSDLATGNLKLGDGTVTTPSLSFTNNDSVGFYRSSLSGFGFVSENKNVLDFTEERVVSFKDFLIRQKILTNSGIGITNDGSGYDVGSFQGVPLVGGSGLSATGNIVVVGFEGSITDTGEGYSVGTYEGIELAGSATGTGAIVDFDVAGILGVVTNPGSGYANGSYADLAVSGGGSGATVNLEVVNGGVVNPVFTGGTGYNQGDVLTATIPGGSGFQFTVTSSPSKITEIQIVNYGSGYQTGDVLTLPGNTSTFSNIGIGGVVDEVTTTLSTSSAQITVADTAGILAGAIVIVDDGPGDLAAGTTVASIDSSTQLTLSANPTVAGAAELTFNTGVPNELTGFSSLTGIEVGQTVYFVSGTGTIGTGVLVDDVDTEQNVVVLDQDAELAGTANIQFGPAYGDPADDFEYTVGELGVVNSISISSGGNGYAPGDVLSVSPVDLTLPTTLTIDAHILQDVTFVQTIAAGTLSVGDNVFIPAGSVLAPITVQSSSDIVGEADAVYTVTAAGATGTGAQFRITRSGTGEVDTVEVLQGGSGYDANEILTIDGSDVGGSDGDDNVDLSITSVSDESDLIRVDKVEEAGGNIVKVCLRVSESGDLVPGQSLVKESTTTPVYAAATVADSYTKFCIDNSLHPSLTLYSGNTYIFDLAGASGQGFALSEFADGNNPPSRIEGVTTTLTALSNTFTVNSATGLLVGMQVSVAGGSGGLAPNTLVTEISGTTITVNQPATVTGLAVLTFSGYEYVDSVTRTTNTLKIRISDDTPDLYYYSTTPGYENYGGDDGSEGLLTTSNSNPKVFGSGATFSITSVQSTDIITSDVESGAFNAQEITGSSLNASTATISTINVTTINGSDINASTITATNDLTINTGASTLIQSGNFDVGGYLQVTGTDGNLTTSGIIKTTNKFSSNDKLEISENKISTVPGQPLLIEPGGQAELVKVISTSALIVPSGDNNQRPLAGENGAIRFNTVTNQYEGYSENSTSWSSLGGVRDLDGNTYILAEASVGANDNTLYFYNDGVNTLKVTPEYQEFVNVKKIRSGNVSAPAYQEWIANAPATLGEYLKYRNNIYEVTTAGTTATSGNEPIHTSGASTNGSAVLTFWGSAVASLTFEEIDELRIDPLGFTDLVVNNELRLSVNEISTTTNDLQLRPNTGQKVTIDAVTSLVIPVGDNNSKGNAAQGSIRYNTDDSQFEGYNGAQWGGLGGVKDIDQDTYIQAESAPGADEDILSFFNANNNTLQVNSTQLEFHTIDTIASMSTNELNLDANTITFSTLDTTLDNTDTASTFLFSTKENFDLGLSSGLNTDPLLRLTDTGDIYYNLGFGTGTYSGVKLFDTDLKVMELADYKVVTNDVSLERGGVATGSSNLHNANTETASKVSLVAHNTTTGDKEFIEFSVITKGSDVYYTEIGNVVTGATLIGSATFDINASNEARITFVLDTNLANGDDVSVTTVAHVIK